MRTLALLGWMLIPVLVGAYHYGPGQERMRLDDVSAVLAEARSDTEAGRLDKAVEAYNRALTGLPAERADDARRIRLERAKVQVFARQLPEANADLEALVDELQDEQAPDPTLLADAREAMAHSQYYLTWLMRLEGLGRDTWEPEVESARQTYRLLAEQAADDGDAARAAAYRQDVESAIRLARMEPGELQGLAIPKQCQGCKSGQCKNPGKKPGRKPGGKEKPKDARGASSGPPPDGSGS